MVFSGILQVDRNIELTRPEHNLMLAREGDSQGRTPGASAQQCNFHKPQTWVERI